MESRDDSRVRSEDEILRVFVSSRSWLVRRLERMLGRGGTAEDVLQDAEMRMLANPPRRDGNLKGFLWSTARNLAIDELRKQRPMAPLPITQSARGLTPEELVSLAELREIVEGLPEGQRICFNMFHFNGNTYAEIAKETGFAQNLVRSYIQNGMIQIKRRMLDR